MRGVYQTRKGFGRGNCVAACLATVLEVPLEEVDWIQGYSQEIVAYTKRWLPAWEYVSVDMGYDYDLVPMPELGEGQSRWTYKLYPYEKPPTEGYWFASVPSKSLVRPPENDYYPLPALHFVVMKGDELAWDPNANNKHERYWGNEIHGYGYWRPAWQKTA